MKRPQMRAALEVLNPDQKLRIFAAMLTDPNPHGLDPVRLAYGLARALNFVEASVSV